MGVYEHFPYTNYQDANIDWVLETTKRMDDLANHLDTEISEEVDAQLQEMIDNGTLGDLINDTLLANINNKVDGVKADVDAITPLDAVPTNGSTKGVTSDGVYDSLSDLRAIAPLDATPTNGSTKGVTSDGVYDAVKTVDDKVSVLNNNDFLQAGKNIVFIGDSLTVGSGASDPSLRFSTLLAEKFNMVEYNFGVGAAGFTRPNLFRAQLTSASSTMSASEKANTGICLICGGANDLRNQNDTTRADFITAVVSCVIQARSIFSNALIVTAIANGILDQYYDTARYWVDLANEAIESLHDQGRILVLTNVASTVNGRGDLFRSDGLHLTDEGHALFAGKIGNGIQGGGLYTESYVGTYTFDPSKAEAGDYIPHVFHINDFIVYGQGTIKLNTAISSNTVIGSYTGPYPYYNLYMPIFQANVQVGTLGIGTTGAVRIIPDSGVTLASGSTVTLRDIVQLYRQYIPPA